MIRDIFLCHASEDKDNVVRPLVEALTAEGVSCWYDEAEIVWGDSITQKVNDGMASAKFVLVVFSRAFVEKNWPHRELNAALNHEASSGEVKVLPLLVGSAAEIKQILEKYPLLNDKRYLPWNGDVNAILDAMLSRLGRRQKGSDLKSVGPSKGDPYIPLPKIKKKFKQRDKDLFLRSSFTVVRQYFEHGLEELRKRNAEIEIDLAEVTKFMFFSTIYVNGEIATRCKIWIGGLSTFDSIAFMEGQSQAENDSSFNELLSVDTNDERLGFKPLGTWFGTGQYTQDHLLTTEQAAEHLWRCFTKPLE